MDSAQQVPPRAIPRRAWVGIDTTQSPAEAVAAWRTAWGLQTAPVAPDVLRRQRPGGERCAAAIPMGQMFTERLETPARSRSQAERLATGMLDLRLPLPVEQCAVTWTGVSPAPGATATLLVFAMPREALDRELDRQGRALVDAERAVPAAHALWLRLLRQDRPPAGTLQLLLHAASASWTLLIGRDADLHSVLALPSGDPAALGRNVQVFAHRWNLSASRLLLCGPGAHSELETALRALPALSRTDIHLAETPGAFLARALAETAAMTADDRTGNLRHGHRPHPARLRREAGRRRLCAGVLIGSALLLLGGQTLLVARARRALAAVDHALLAACERLAGRPGVTVSELALREMENRINPAIEAFGETQLPAKAARLLSTAALRGMTLNALAVDDRRIEVTGEAAGEADVAAWRDAARGEQLAPAIETEWTSDGHVRFSGTLMRRGTLP